MVGMFNRYADGKSALITLLVGLGLMIIGTFFTGEVKETETSGWLKDYFGSPFHYMGAVFALLIALQLALSAAGMKRAEPYVQVDAGLVDLTPWKPARYVGAALILLVLAIYAFFAI
jgi:SSS family solute:Na+ symporter